MAVPKVRTSKSKRNMRRSHDALTPQYGSVCANCGSIKHSHAICPSCGFYRGKQVMKPRQSMDALTTDFEA
jgi:large subunit ribosomal protein L32